MSGPEAQKPDDQLLEEFLAGKGAVRTAYREAAQPQAPAHLDAAILQMAQTAARPAPRLLRRRWQTPMAAAAVVVLSFGVLLQVQRDPVAQKEVRAPLAPVAPTAGRFYFYEMQDAAKAEEAAPVREVANAEQKQEFVAVAKSKSLPPLEKRRATPPDAAPPAPPPAMAMADAPSPAVSPEPEAAAMGAMESESMPRRERFAAAAPMAKASRAPQASMLMSLSDADNIPAASAIERWAQSCVADSPDLNALRQWRGLALSSWSRQAGHVQVQTTLLFAPELTGEAIKAALGALAKPAALPSSQCPRPVTRELRRAGEAWALVCECRLDAE